MNARTSEEVTSAEQGKELAIRFSGRRWFLSGSFSGDGFLSASSHLRVYTRSWHDCNDLRRVITLNGMLYTPQKLLRKFDPKPGHYRRCDSCALAYFLLGIVLTSFVSGKGENPLGIQEVC